MIIMSQPGLFVLICIGAVSFYTFMVCRDLSSITALEEIDIDTCCISNATSVRPYEVSGRAFSAPSPLC